ncbi:B12-binding domain-containing radical SAM protein [Candidatus Omnitrophota bacterium]
MKILGLNPPSKFSKNVARDLLWGCWCKGKRIAGVQFPPLPLMFIATVLKEKKFDVDVVDAQAENTSLKDLEKNICDYDVVFLISATMSYAEDADVLASLKKVNPRLKTIVFGAHATYLPEAALARDSVDIIVRKEAEFVIRDIITALSGGDDSWKKVKGIGYRQDGQIVINADYPYIENLDELPIPDRSLLNQSVYYYNPIIKKYPWTTVLSSRGCPSRCTFCTSPSYYGPVYRACSAEKVVEEMIYLKSLGYKEIFFRDEAFTTNAKRVFDICRLLIEKNVGLNWICSAKASRCSYELLKVMKEAGCRIIRVGVESGVQQILDNVKKDVKVEQVEELFKNTRKLNIETHAHMMLGMPGETEETVAQTFAFIHQIKPSTVTYGIMTPYPGTPIYEEVLKKDPLYGEGTHIDAASVHTNASFSYCFTSLPQRRVEELVQIGYRKFYARPSYVFERLMKIRDFAELRRLLIAGTQVFSFIRWGDK